MLAIPYLDKHGKPLTMRFRCIEEHDHRAHGHGKYNSIKGDPARVYGVDSIHQAGDELHVAEGEFDRLVLTKVVGPAIALPGASMWRPHHRRMLAGFSRVYVWSDPDEAGAELGQKITRSLRSAKVIRLRDGDVSETYEKGGADALLALINRTEKASA